MAAVLAISNPVAIPAAAQEEAPLPTRSQAYLRDAIALAGIIGSAHGVRFVCHGDGDQYWRQHMMDLLAIEAPQRGSLRDSMVGAFNNNFTRVRNQHRRCTDQVLKEEVAYAAEGRDLANKMAASFFPRPR
ncbi:MAG: TIGR02301 family protein [Pseudomonadota bacterium]